MKLSRKALDTLRRVAEAGDAGMPTDPHGYRIGCVSGSSAAALQRRGLVRYVEHRSERFGIRSWRVRITDKGREVLEEEGVSRGA